jgi:hypothetical protein
VIHELWERQDASLLILPASVPVDLRQMEADATRWREEDQRRSGAFGGDHTAGTTSGAGRCAEKPAGYDAGSGAAVVCTTRRYHSMAMVAAVGPTGSRR